MKRLAFLMPNRWTLLLAVPVIAAVVMWQNSVNHRELMEQQRRIEAAEQARIDEPVETWFVVRNIAIPDFVAGEDPPVVYDREIRKPFTATWNVEIHAVGEATNFPVCTGSGTNRYETSEILPPAGISLSWFTGTGCDVRKLPPAQYTAKTYWEVRPDGGYPVKPLTFTSNVFRVLPEGAQPFVSPEQVQKLEQQEDVQ